LSKELKTFYIVEATLIEMKAFNGSIMQKDNSKSWLSWTHEGGGWPDHSSEKSSAYKFKSLPTTKELAKWDGMPWYYRMKSVKIFKITEETYYKRTEEEIPNG